MTTSRKLFDAASRVLAGDDSRVAAEELEGVILEEFDNLEDPRIVALVEALALYAPGSGSPYVDPPELRELIAATLLTLNASTADDWVEN